MALLLGNNDFLLALRTELRSICIGEASPLDGVIGDICGLPKLLDVRRRDNFALVGGVFVISSNAFSLALLSASPEYSSIMFCVEKTIT